MADSASTPVPVLVKDNDGALTATWTTTATGGVATGTGVQLGKVQPGSAFFQVTGTFASATCALEGSCDGSNWAALYATQQVATAGKNDVISLTATGLFALLSVPKYLRFKSTGGTNSTLVATVTAQRG